MSKDFPTTSLGRTLSPRLQGSSESLSHPLLSQNQNQNSPLSATRTTPDPLSSLPPKYATYTPRHRPAPPLSPTTSTSAQSTASVVVQNAGGAGATGKLQMQNLKAACQGVGLAVGSVGWAMLERLCGEGDGGSGWSEAWGLVATGKATLLLPSETLTGNLDFSASFIKDHVVFCNGPSVTQAPLITMSGLRGIIEGEKVTFRSTISTTSTLYARLLNPATRSSALLSAPPLPHVQAASYPTYALPHYTSNLPCPPRVPPPLPARPAVPARPSPTPSTRLGGAFTSLFGRPSTPTLSAAPTAAAASQSPRPPSPSPSIETKVNPEPQSPAPTPISVFVIDKPIRRAQVLKDIQRATKAHIKDILGSSGMGLPNWVVTRAVDFSALLNELYFTAGGQLVVADGEDDSASIKSLRVRRKPGEWLPDLSTPASTSESFQAFFNALEEDASAFYAKAHAKAGSQATITSSEKGEEVPLPNKETMDAVERVLCSLFYDRLFAPEGSDDKNHDEALAGRVAALNMLDLTLEHLGVEVADGADAGVEKVVQAVGRELQRLEDPLCRGPNEKAAVLVTAHNVIVDGLGKLPPVSLKPDNEDSVPPPPPPPPLDMDKTPRQPTFPPSVTVTPDSEKVETPPIPSTPERKTPVSSDILLPMLIYSIVKSNPTQLVSHILYVERYRHRSASGGEEGFCLINVMAAAEFLENVDMAALGLTEADRVSVADLDPIPLPPSTITNSAQPADNLPARLRGRVEQQVGELAGSANKVLSGVVDTGFSALRGLLSAAPATNSSQPSTTNTTEQQDPTTSPRQGFGLLRRASGFSIASVARLRSASMSTAFGGAASVHQDEGGQQMVEVPSRPGSLRSRRTDGDDSSAEETSEEDNDEGESALEDEEDGEGEEAEGEEGLEGEAPKSDVRSIRSFGSMFSEAKEEGASSSGRGPRKSLTERLASASGRLSVSSGSKAFEGRKISPPGSRRTSLLLSPKNIPPIILPSDSIAPPNPRFLRCDPEDLKIGEIASLLQDYRRLADALRSRGAFTSEGDVFS